MQADAAGLGAQHHPQRIRALEPRSGPGWPTPSRGVWRLRQPSFRRPGSTLEPRCYCIRGIAHRLTRARRRVATKGRFRLPALPPGSLRPADRSAPFGMEGRTSFPQLGYSSTSPSLVTARVATGCGGGAISSQDASLFGHLGHVLAWWNVEGYVLETVTGLDGSKGSSGRWPTKRGLKSLLYTRK
jgi:hypothetical protein